MYHPTRGGVRGGRDQFTWDSVKTDKDRECYLGHSLMAPVGRWQEGKDIMWYAKDDQKSKNGPSSEFLRAKEMEEQALMAALGYRVVKKEEKQIKQEDYEEVKVKQEGAQFFEIDDKKELDKMLLKLVNKYGKDQLFEALGGKKKKDKRKKKRSHESSDSDDSRKRKSSNTRSKKRKSRHSSSDSSSDSD